MSWLEIFSAVKWLKMSRDRFQVSVSKMEKVTLILQLDKDPHLISKQTLGTCLMLHMCKLLHTNPLSSPQCLGMLKLHRPMLHPTSSRHLTMYLFQILLILRPNINHIRLWPRNMANRPILGGEDHTMVHPLSNHLSNQDLCPGLLTPFHLHLLILPLTIVAITDNDLPFA